MPRPRAARARGTGRCRAGRRACGRRAARRGHARARRRRDVPERAEGGARVAGEERTGGCPGRGRVRGRREKARDRGVALELRVGEGEEPERGRPAAAAAAGAREGAAVEERVGVQVGRQGEAEEREGGFEAPVRRREAGHEGGGWGGSMARRWG